MSDMKIHSNGWGIQSVTLIAMQAFGDIARADYIFHSDTLHESQLTYDYIDKWQPYFERMGLSFMTVTNPTGGLFQLFKEHPGQTHVPAFTLRSGIKHIVEYGDNDEIIGKYEKYVNELGQLNRSCTQRWKIVPMRRWEQANRNGRRIEQWIGISLDEFIRIKPSDVKFITNRWPLIENNMTRKNCEDYLISKGIEIPPKSACTFCPFHDMSEWRRIKSNDADWQEAVKADTNIRDVRPGYRTFIHPSRIPLADVDFRTQEHQGQVRMWDDECAGICGV